MKKIYSLLTLFLLVAGAFAVSSCELYIEDDYYHPGYNTGNGDRARAYTLSGEWQGNLNMFYAIVNPRTGEAVEFDANYSYITFYSDYAGARSGWGKQIDFYNYGPYRYQYYKFYWEVRGGVIYLSYPKDHNLDTQIYDYQLSNNYFTGYMGDNRRRFTLSSIHYNDWNRFTGDFFFQPFDEWSWGMGYTAPKAFDSTTATRAAQQATSTTDIVAGRRLSPTAAQ